MPFGSVRRSSGFTSAIDERHVGIHAERGRVVDDERAGGGRTRRPLERERVVDVDDHEVEAVEAVVAQHLAHDLAAHERQLAARATAATRTRAARPRGRRAARARAASPDRRDRWLRSRRSSRRCRASCSWRCLETERAVQGAHRRFDVGVAHDARDPDRRRADHLDVDSFVGERLEHLGGDAGVGLHARADERDATDLGIRAVAPRLGVDDDLVHDDRGLRADPIGEP